VAAEADGVIIGSALVDLVAKSPMFDDALAALRDYLTAASAAIGKPQQGGTIGR
jgi:tryptophan synthase alpha subunit